MQVLKQSLYILSAIFLLGSCVTQKKTTTTSQTGKYSEDLSVWRPKVEAAPAETNTTSTTTDNTKATTTVYVEPKLTVNRRLDGVLDSIDHINLSRKFVEGYTIQVYSGRREEALNAKKQIATALPKLNTEVQFTEPIFRVKVGKYFSRMDAQQDYAAVKRYFPAAILIPEKISIQ
ncbi:SPOR domain-containing protein [Ohtaekwangia koreensis]|uniref:Sporulation related domain-containing protein n=1 Tax=Ohtaekwangia koreensis TaxID=688867 RepID=A0A1T5LD28_9BACT|nr:SPOR domain-containing protein [Ohtaekwangia koreensis]SKC73318.1 Sporulation related domain-containing protein [Ohtaekwangia koreensis]